MFSLSARLSAVAALVPPGARVADVGTDHGYIPAYLALTGAAPYLVASDIQPGPLENARRTAAAWGVADQIRFVLAPGLRGVDPGTVDTVILAGMGGETILSILEQDPWALESGMTLILQPQSKTELLTRWLWERGVTLQDGQLVEEDGKFYAVYLARRGHGPAPQGASALVSPVLLQKRDPLLPRYLDLLLFRGQRALAGMRRGAGTAESRIEEMEALCRGLREMKEEMNLWPQ